MEDLPLAGRRIVVTRTQEGGAKLAGRLQELGAEAIEVPLIRIVPPTSYEALDQALGRLPEYDVLLVTSANTARVLAERRPTPWNSQPFTAVIGPATAQAMRDAGLRVDLQPSPSIAESLVRELAPTASAKHILLPRAQTARELLPDALRAAGARVDVVAAYRTLPEERSGALLQALCSPGEPPVDAVTFTSGSTVHSFFQLLGDQAHPWLRRMQVFSIGPVTTAVFAQYRAAAGSAEPRLFEAATHDLDGLVAMLVQHLQTPAEFS
jgi:uroporphyrinogen-III synthase